MAVQLGPGSMSKDQWATEWQAGKTPFHKKYVHRLLEKHFDVMINGRKAIQIFVPWCGKAVDMKWLADRGHTVVGVEFSSLACEEFFQEQNVEYTVETIKRFFLYKSNDGKIRLYCGDFFQFDSSFEGKMDGYWDRGALVAVDECDRDKYCDIMMELSSPETRGFIETFNYDPTKYAGPPHFITDTDLYQFYGEKCDVEQLDYVHCFAECPPAFGLDRFDMRLHLITQKSPATDDRHGKGNLSLNQWVSRWQDGKAGFHKQDVHSLLEKHVDKIVNGRKAIKVFFPLCGKAVDMKWLADLGHTIVGVEFSSQACEEFFREQNVKYTTEVKKNYILFKSKDGKIRLYCGDFFAFNSSYEGKMDAFWDRGAFVAVKTCDRQKYCAVMFELCSSEVRGLLATYDYDSTKWHGPPQFVTEEQINELYGDDCQIERVDYVDALQDRHRSWGLDRFYERLHLITC